MPKTSHELSIEFAVEITEELMQSEAELLILLGDIPIAQYLKKAADIPYSTLGASVAYDEMELSL